MRPESGATSPHARLAATKSSVGGQTDIVPGLQALDLYGWCMTRTTIEIDDRLVAEIMCRCGVATKKEAVDLALRRLMVSR
jgi:hypothetical protein